ncbi:MAG: hypothetical protein A2V85_01440 [Chloroflexi bacterium RBG_16_72_14]|nr:MAG: hypothetical protein A2V85_01440 [Chloroflexi bacterium RBG_16_72_14]
MGLFAGAAILVAACGGTSTTPSPSAAAPATPAATTAPESAEPTPSGPVDLFNPDYGPEAGTTGGSIIIGDWQEATQFNPYYLGQVTEANVASAVWYSLVTISHDFKYIPQLAVAPIPTVDNGGVKLPGDNGDAMTVTWKIQSGVKWSDGEPLTCDDFKYAWEWVLDGDNVGVITTGFEDISAIDCSSDTDMVWHFTKVFEGYAALFGPQVPPLPRHYLSGIPVKDQTTGSGFRPDEVPNLPVSGPFKFGTVTPGAELRLVRNDNFVNPRTGKPANLDSIIFKWYADADAMIAGYRGNEVDIAVDLQDSDIPKVTDLGEQVHAIPALLYEFLRPNWSADTCSTFAQVQDRGSGCPVSDAAIRVALAYAIDKNEINTRLLGGNTQVANTNTSPSAWFYADQAPTNYDPAKAMQVLDEAGWTDSDGDGIREKGGLKAKVELCTTTRQVRQDTLALVSAWLRAVGIESVINAVAPADIFADYNESTRETPCVLAWSNFDIAEHAFSSSIDPFGNYGVYHSSQFEPNGQNDARIVDADVDAALDTVKNSVDFAVIKDAMATFLKVYVDKTIEVPLYYRKNVELVSPAVGNYFANGTLAGLTWNSEDWFGR